MSGVDNWFLTAAVVLLGGGLIYFVKRYIDKNDEGHAEVKATLKQHGVEMHDLTQKIKESTDSINTTATNIQRDYLKFQSEINSELLKIHKTTTEITSDLTQSTSKIKDIAKDVSDIYDIIEKHQASLSQGAQAIYKQRQMIDEIKTKITKISPDAFIVGEEKKGGKK